MLDLIAELARSPYVRPGVWYNQRGLDGIVGLTIHYTAAPPAVSVYNVAMYQVGAGAQEAFPAIAYTYYVEADGRAIRCHPLTTRCWHSGAVVNGISRNRSHVGICYAGDREPNAAQRAGLRECIADAEAQLGRTLEIEGHRDAPYATQCPGPTWPIWKGELRMPTQTPQETLAALETTFDALWRRRTGKTSRSRTVLDIARRYAPAELAAVAEAWTAHKAALGEPPTG